MFKKKFKFKEDDEKALVDTYRAKFSEKIIECLANNFNGFEAKSPYIVIEQKLGSRDPTTLQYFDTLLRKKNLKEFDPEGKRILLRVHLRVGNTAEHIQKQKGLIKYNEGKTIVLFFFLDNCFH